MKKLALLLVFAMLLPLAAACAQNNEDKDQEEAGDSTALLDESTEPEETRLWLDELPDELDFNERVIKFVVSDQVYDLGKRSIEAEETTGEGINDAVYERNTNVEERLNVDIQLVKEFDSMAMAQAIRLAVQADSNDYDVVAAYQYNSIVLAAENMLLDLNQFDYLNLDANYWATEMIDNMSYRHQRFWATGDITLKYIGGISVTYVNQRIYNEFFQDTDIFQMVYDKKWTLDKLNEMSSAVYNDLNGNSEIDLEDQLGFIVAPEDPLDSLMCGSGVTFCEFDNEGVPTFNFNKEKMVNLHEKLYDLVWNTGATYWMADGGDSRNVMDAYMNGNICFTVNKLWQTEYYLRYMEDDYYMIPVPLFDENQNQYYSMTHDGCLIYGIPTTMPIGEDTDAITATLEAMAAESYRLVTPAYFDVALKNKYARDEESSKMLDYIRTTVVMDFAMLYMYEINSIANCYRQWVQVPSIASAIERMITRYEKLFNSLCEKFEQNLS